MDSVTINRNHHPGAALNTASKLLLHNVPKWAQNCLVFIFGSQSTVTGLARAYCECRADRDPHGVAQLLEAAAGTGVRTSLCLSRVACPTGGGWHTEVQLHLDTSCQFPRLFLA